MKLNSSVLLPALAWSAHLSEASIGSVYIFDPQDRRLGAAGSKSLSPEVARIVLAQRVGVEDYHGLSSMSGAAIEAINEFGFTRPLFSAEYQRPRALILVEGVEDAESHMSSLKDHTQFTISSAPSASASRGLFIDLAKQSDPTAFSHLSDEDTITLLKDGRTLTNNGDLFHLAQSFADFEALFTQLAEEDWSITAMIMPSPAEIKVVHNAFGTYEMPSPAQALLGKRQGKEEPLELAPELDFTPVQSTSAPVSSIADSTPLSGILPACFSSQSSCESMTRNCTGHGRCGLKYTDVDANDEGGVKCYSCRCTADVQKVGSNGLVKTTKWGGPACQKKDVSVPFWLLAGFTVGLVSVVAWGIGTLLSMGEEKLPSVIGAGVSGPPRK